MRNELAESSYAELIVRRVTSEHAATVSLAKVASVSPSFLDVSVRQAGFKTSTEHTGTAHAVTALTSTYMAQVKRRRGTTEYAPESVLIHAVINGVELYLTGDNQSEISHMGWAEFVSLALPYDDGVDRTMTGITRDWIPLSCCIRKAPLNIGAWWDTQGYLCHQERKESSGSGSNEKPCYSTITGRMGRCGER